MKNAAAESERNGRIRSLIASGKEKFPTGRLAVSGGVVLGTTTQQSKATRKNVHRTNVLGEPERPPWMAKDSLWKDGTSFML